VTLDLGVEGVEVDVANLPRRKNIKKIIFFFFTCEYVLGVFFEEAITTEYKTICAVVIKFKKSTNFRLSHVEYRYLLIF
jgi:hypothetical protein